MKYLPGSAVSSQNKLHQIRHWWLKVLDLSDYVRAWTSPIRSAANEIMRRINVESRNKSSVDNPMNEIEPECLYAPDITIEQNVDILVTIPSDIN